MGQAQIKEAEGGFDKGESWQIDLPIPPHSSPGHLEVIANFARAISDGEPLIAPAAEALNSVMLANAIMLSSFKGQTIKLPFDAGEYEAKLNELVRNSRFSKNETKELDGDVNQSFQ